MTREERAQQKIDEIKSKCLYDTSKYSSFDDAVKTGGYRIHDHSTKNSIILHKDDTISIILPVEAGYSARKRDEYILTLDKLISLITTAFDKKEDGIKIATITINNP